MEEPTVVKIHNELGLKTVPSSNVKAYGLIEIVCISWSTKLPLRMVLMYVKSVEYLLIQPLPLSATYIY
jgi:hypothetical protein